MIPLIEQHRQAIVALCVKYGVKRLELFGSAARGDDFDASKSDVDFLVDLDSSREAPGDDFFDLKDDLETMLGRKVDLVDMEATKNPWFWVVANRCRIPLHAA